MPSRDLVRVWGVIPARGGSKGIPGKNLVKVQGRTLIARAVTACVAAQSLERVFVSTDDAAIAAAAAAAGAEILDRPVEIAGDTASSEAALLHALDVLEGRGENLPDLLCFVQCTSPFIRPSDIDGTVAAQLDADADCAFTATATHGFLWRLTSQDEAVGVNHDSRTRQRRQDREPEYLETGAVYVMRVAEFRRVRHRFFGKIAIHVVDGQAALEIDRPADLDIARAVAPIIEPQLLASLVPMPLGGVVFDFDGVMSDDTVLVHEDGSEAVFCNRFDGAGIAALKRLGVNVAVITAERASVAAQRCAKLGITCISGSANKLEALQALCVEWATPLSGVIYTGNDLGDLECVAAAGLGIAVAGAHPKLLAQADLILAQAGARGAVRCVCDLVLEALAQPPGRN